MSDFQTEIAARTVWMEARGEGPSGLAAVAWVIANRLRSGRWYSGHTLAGCCLLASQFSCWNTHDPNRQAMAVLPETDPTLEQCRSLVGIAVANQTQDPVEGATHYYDERLPSPPDWSVGAIPIRQIGHHLFFKGIA